MPKLECSAILKFPWPDKFILNSALFKIPAKVCWHKYSLLLCQNLKWMVSTLLPDRVVFVPTRYFMNERSLNHLSLYQHSGLLNSDHSGPLTLLRMFYGISGPQFQTSAFPQKAHELYIVRFLKATAPLPISIIWILFLSSGPKEVIERKREFLLKAGGFVVQPLAGEAWQ